MKRISEVSQGLLNKIGMAPPTDKKKRQLESRIVIANRLNNLLINDDFAIGYKAIVEEVRQEQTKILLNHTDIKLREEARIRLQVLDLIEQKMKIKIGDGEKFSNILTRFKEEQ